MQEVLLSTKLKIPPGRKNLVIRPRLIEQLNAGLEGKVILVTAPAGYGKTTLLSEWSARCSPRRRVTWLSLDKDDDDLARFLAYFVAALQAIEPDICLAVSSMLQPPQPAPIPSILSYLINDLACLAGDFVIFLDEYHLIESQPIHNALAYLLDHMPDQMHIVLSTRADPPLPLARLRARGELLELRAADLCFNAREVEELFNDTLGLSLSSHEIEALAARTEGWISGLQLAAYALKSLSRHEPDSESIHRFIGEFAGSNRHILDYLLEEVLERQTEKIQTFLLQTSILDRLTGPLCDAVTEIEDTRIEDTRIEDTREESCKPTTAHNSQRSIHHSQQIIEYLEHNNLFIVPLDEERRWYRYHRFFADLLRQRLLQVQPEKIPSLHRGASQWFERNGYIAAAIDHSLSAGDFDHAAYLIEQAAEPTINRSETSLFLTWVEQLPDASIRARSALCIFHALALLLNSQKFEAIETRLEQARAAAPEGAIAVETAALRALLAMLKGDIQKSIQLSRSALEVLTEDQLLFQSLAADNLGMCYVLSGDLPSASQAFEEVVRIAQRSGNTMMAVAALSNLAGLQVVQGHLHGAWAHYQEILELATDRNGRRLPVAGKALFGLGELAREMNDLEAASHYLTEAIDLLTQFVEIGLVIALLSLARVRQAQGDWDSAWDLLHQAQQKAGESRSVQMDDRLVEVARARFSIQQGRYDQALSWAKERRLDENPLAGISVAAGSPGFDIIEPEYLTLARLYLAQGFPEKALEILEAMLEIDERKGRVRRMIEVLSLQAVALETKGEVDHALTVLERALAIAGLEGYARTFIDEGTPMKRLLHQAVQRGIEPEYAGRLLAALLEQEGSGRRSKIPGGYPAGVPPSLPLSPGWKPETGTIEPLSDRELEVLQLIAQGMSNSEVAARLVISFSTVKGHTTNIYSKLMVNSRTQAVARARELGILS